ncbi:MULTISPECIES: ArsR/SmtB family transcription factor [unclassified Sinorhizobium]|uniref:ArsR/SmtB family transcription factor n=1 Tax=unclassified Sinorhizobium TaxID=2613772 RepID=UPI003525AC0A
MLTVGVFAGALVTHLDLHRCLIFWLDPVRLRLLARLVDSGQENCSSIGEGIKVHKSTMSHHYRVLREAGITRTIVEGRSRYVSLRRDDLNRRFPGLRDAILTQVR